MVMFEQLAAQREEEAARLRAEEKARLLEFWATQQQPHQRKEYDLNNPHSKRMDEPSRLDVDHDPALGPASLQVFQGEDSSGVDRANVQKAQVRDWVKQQVAEKQAKVDRAREEERLYQLQQIELANRAIEMEAAAERARRDMARATAEYNLALARERKEKDRDRAIEEVCEAMEEIKTNLTSDLLTENPAQAEGLGGKKVVDSYKGMSPAELAAIRREQELQTEEKERLRREELRKAAEWERYNKTVLKAVAKSEAEVAREKDAERRAHLEELRRQQEEKRMRDERLRRENTNQPSDAFFRQFGTSTR
jgi:hypothetical protein